MPIKPKTHLRFISKTSLLCSFILSRSHCLSCALIAHPALSHFELLSHSLPATEGNKILLLWELLTERRTAAYETSSVETEAYIWLFPVCGLGGGFNLLWKLCLSFLCEKLWDRWSDRQSEKQRDRQAGGWHKERCMESGVADIDQDIWQKVSCYC